MACLLLLLGGIGGRFAWPRDEATSTLMPAAAAHPVPASLAQAVIRVHAECSGYPELHGSSYPRELVELASAVRADLDQETPYLDLSRAGYQLIGAGPCRRQVENTIHSLYRRTGKNVSAVLSVFVRSFEGQVQLDPGAGERAMEERRCKTRHDDVSTPAVAAVRRRSPQASENVRKVRFWPKIMSF